MHFKTENDIGKYHHCYSQKNLQKFQQFQLPAVFDFHEWQYRISSGISRPEKILSTTNYSPLMASLCIYTLMQIFKERHLRVVASCCELRHVNPLASWDMSIHLVTTVTCVNLQSENVLKLSKLINSSARYQNSNDLRLNGQCFKQDHYILIMTFSLVRWSVNYILIENKNKFYLR